MSQDIFGDAAAYAPLVPSITSGYDKVFYYDAVSGKGHGESQVAYEDRVQPEHDRFAKIQALDRVHVVLGQVVGEDRRQKGVDVRLAVDMMTQAFRGNISRATLFAGDADFTPLVSALVNEGLHVTLWHPPQANAALRGAADTTSMFDFRINYSAFTSDGVSPAFQVSNTGSLPGGGRPDLDKLGSTARGGSQLAARWQNNVLKVYRKVPDSNWTFVTFAAPNETLERAIAAFDAILGWNVSTDGGRWIAT